jgi:hypothetical protein
MSDEPQAQGDGPQTPEELIREMARRLAQTPVRDLLLQTLATFADLAGVRLGYGPDGAEHRDLPQARLAIETLRALIGVADEQIGPAQARPFREPLAQLQMLYAREVEADAAGTSATDEADAAGAPDGEGALWTPGKAPGGEGAGIWTPGSQKP